LKIKKNNKNSHMQSRDFSVSIALMIVFILSGIVVGTVCCFATDFFPSNLGFITQIDKLGQNGFDYSFFQSLFNFSKYPLLIFIFGLTALGFFVTPVLVFLKGFFLSFSVSAIFKCIEKNALLLAFSIFGVQVVFSIPCIIFFASVSFEFSKNFVNFFKKKTQIKKINKVRPQEYFFIFLIVIIFVFLFAFLDTLITPKLIEITTKI